MQSMQTWEMILVGVVVLLVLLWFRPGIKAALAHSQQVEKKDWKGVLIPIALVVIFVIFLISTL